MRDASEIIEARPQVCEVLLHGNLETLIDERLLLLLIRFERCFEIDPGVHLLGCLEVWLPVGGHLCLSHRDAGRFELNLLRHHECGSRPLPLGDRLSARGSFRVKGGRRPLDASLADS